jgi:hypothetical protein
MHLAASGLALQVSYRVGATIRAAVGTGLSVHLIDFVKGAEISAPLVRPMKAPWTVM